MWFDLTVRAYELSNEKAYLVAGVQYYADIRSFLQTFSDELKNP
jgi:hypothetical protein